ncbi:hypothetical protein DFH07DRAFT_773694 [Mycena maculata]|uniref:Secreted protein n=1 Tax=Mycena maculata TaxID=230809 RepID=A0AAD7J0X2_9AGAR|nr:hypothetical protein DFH07DRAFT_773694 [Mycena maculata]
MHLALAFSLILILSVAFVLCAPLQGSEDCIGRIDLGSSTIMGRASLATSDCIGCMRGTLSTIIVRAPLLRMNLWSGTSGLEAEEARKMSEMHSIPSLQSKLEESARKSHAVNPAEPQAAV